MKKNNTARDPIVRSVATIFLGLIVLALVYNVFFTPGPMMQGYGLGMGNSGHMAHGMSGGISGGWGISFGSILAGILIILIKLLSILLVVGLIVGIWVVFREYMFQNDDDPISTFIKGFSKPKMNCPKCGSNINANWEFCPDCGERLARNDKPVPDESPA